MANEDLARYEERYGLLSVGKAREIVTALSHVLPGEFVDLDGLAGRILVEDVVSTERLPPFPASIVDGYAIDAGDGQTIRTVVGDVLAGDVSDRSLRPGQAARIMTGAPLPRGATAAAMFENVDLMDGKITIRGRRPRDGENVRQPGIDIDIGQVVLKAGTQIGPPEIGLLATLGIGQALVGRRPRVAVLSTGDELVDPGAMLGPGSIRDSNRFALRVAIEEAGGEVVSLGRVRDDEVEQRAAIVQALGIADVLITSGGVSVGSRDLIKPILEELGQVHFGRIALRPGKPLTFATVGQRLAFGLPGNPVSALVTFEIFVRPALRIMQGCPSPDRPRLPVRVEYSVPRTLDRTEYQRAIVRWKNGELVARGTGSQASSRLLSLVGANALIEVLPGDENLPAGSVVPALIIGEIVT
ncbi:MAG: molybdopterin molybdenumtransferase MoeA [Chloroflexota bacterium]|nr:MAG: molybdopterin molybdenumtransferase MoeA [Chloroflexota bacterium]